MLLPSPLHIRHVFLPQPPDRYKTSLPQHPSGLTGAQFHPDGVIFGLGTGSGAVRIWDVKEQTNVATFEGHSGALRAMAFSENGYYMATAAEDATVKLWDLRKLRAFHTIEFDAAQDINALAFDYSGSYLAIGGSDIRYESG